jgi:hypothetical protein
MAMAERDGFEDDADRAGLRDVARHLVESWNRGDSAAFGRLFTPTAEYVTGAGRRVRGRQAIEGLLPITAPATRISLAGRPEARCGSRSGELEFDWSGADAAGRVRRGRITCACIREGPGWLIEALRNDEATDVADSRGRPR